MPFKMMYTRWPRVMYRQFTIDERAIKFGLIIIYWMENKCKYGYTQCIASGFWLNDKPKINSV